MLLAIPIYNEKKTIPSLIKQTLANLPEQVHRVVCIDDGSTDGSAEVLDEEARRHSNIEIVHQAQNGGYGRSILTSLEIGRARGYTHVITMDCDLQHRPEDLIRFVQEPMDIDLVSGSRYMPESQSQGHAPGDRMEINGRITALLNSRYNWNLTDSFCGFKRFRLAKIDPSVFSETGYAFPMEFWAYARTQKLTIHEIPVSRIYTTDNRTFGEDLDRKRRRYRYYLETLHRSERKFKIQ